MGIIEVAAGAGVHRGDQKEGTGEGQLCIDAGNGDDLVLQRLAQGFQDILAILWEFVHEKDTVMGQGYFTRCRDAAAADDAGAGSCMVR